MNFSLSSLVLVNSYHSSPLLALNRYRVCNCEFVRFFSPLSICSSASFARNRFSQFLTGVIRYEANNCIRTENRISDCVFEFIQFSGKYIIFIDGTDGEFEITRTRFAHNRGPIQHYGHASILVSKCKEFKANQLCFINTSSLVTSIYSQYDTSTTAFNVNNTATTKSFGHITNVIGANQHLVFHFHNNSYLSETEQAFIWWHPTAKEENQVKFICIHSSTNYGVVGAYIETANTWISMSNANIINTTARIFFNDNKKSHFTVFNSVILSVPADHTTRVTFTDCYLYDPLKQFTMISFDVQQNENCALQTADFSSQCSMRMNIIILINTLLLLL